MKEIRDGLGVEGTSLVAQTVKASAYNVGDQGSIPGMGRSPGVGNGNPLQYSCLENPRDRGAWWATSMGCKDSDMTERLNMHVYNEDINSIFHRVMV